jgi:hypothetical protein
LRAVDRANAHDAIVLDQIVLHREARAKLGARLDRRFDEHPVEGASPRAVAEGDAVERQIPPAQADLVRVDRERGARGAAGGDDALEQAPLLQSARAMAMNEMAVRDFARKRGPVDQQHLETAASEKHGGRGARAARADDDGVVDPAHGIPPCLSRRATEPYPSQSQARSATVPRLDCGRLTSRLWANAMAVIAAADVSVTPNQRS